MIEYPTNHESTYHEIAGVDLVITIIEDTLQWYQEKHENNEQPAQANRSFFIGRTADIGTDEIEEQHINDHAEMPQINHQIAQEGEENTDIQSGI